MKRLFITDWAPNGCQDLIIADDEGQVIGYVDEAVFGLRAQYDHACLHGGSIVRELDDETKEYMTEYASFSESAYVAEVSLEQVLKHIAVSPVSDGSELIDALKTHGLIK